MHKIILIIIVIVIIVAIFSMRQSSEGFGYPTSYEKLGCGYNSPLFSPMVAKRCSGGPYMYTSNPYLKAVCEGVSNSELAQVSCGKAFHGRPVHFQYSQLSDGAWSNALCNCSSKPTSLCTL